MKMSCCSADCSVECRRSSTQRPDDEANLGVIPRELAYSRKSVDQRVNLVQTTHKDENVTALVHVCSVIRSDSSLPRVLSISRRI